MFTEQKFGNSEIFFFCKKMWLALSSSGIWYIIVKVLKSEFNFRRFIFDPIIFLTYPEFDMILHWTSLIVSLGDAHSFGDQGQCSQRNK